MKKRAPKKLAPTTHPDVVAFREFLINDMADRVRADAVRYLSSAPPDELTTFEFHWSFRLTPKPGGGAPSKYPTQIDELRTIQLKRNVTRDDVRIIEQRDDIAENRLWGAWMRAR